MSIVNVYRLKDSSANIGNLKIKREWMDGTQDAHAYKCFPVTLTNSLGWGISYPEDIEFIWDGISDTTPVHVKVLKGEQYISTGRANATISFNTGLIFETDENTSLIHMPVPNQFIDGVQAFTTIISSSFYKNPFPVAWKITKPNVPILIPAGTPIISVVPVSIGAISDSELNIYDNSEDKFGQDHWKRNRKYGERAQEINQTGGWTNFYRNATDETETSIGSHEVKAIRMPVKDHTK